MNFLQYVNTDLKLKTVLLNYDVATKKYSHNVINEDFFIVSVFIGFKRVDNISLSLDLPEMECAINDFSTDLNLDLINLSSFQVSNVSIVLTHLPTLNAVSSDYGVFRPTHKYIGFVGNRGFFGLKFKYSIGNGSLKYFEYYDLNTGFYVDGLTMDSTGTKFNFFFKGFLCKIVSSAPFLTGDEFKIFLDPFKNTFYATGVLGNLAQNIGISDSAYILEDGSHSINMKVGGSRTCIMTMLYLGK
ncbi:hypothetical protein [Flavobacterium yafengii]|uniref:hypothetical protein n=1 Tax=Flavobacterium yafengii TaxID=3041253 RepID=UPI0024A8F153|nr:hypothetical protein [Flavobacterium yafengii]MDI5898742.1 hypothetical protein [Flavobacterium yafengii]